MNQITIMIILASLTAWGCAQKPLNINWDDKRCVKYSDMFQRLKSEHSGKNSAAAFAYLLAGNAKQASINFNGGGVQWVEGYSGDSQRVWVAYNEAGETVGYKDLNGTELTLADLDLIGGVITKYSNIAEQNPTYQMKFRLAQTPGYTPRPIYAAKMPENCIR